MAEDLASTLARIEQTLSSLREDVDALKHDREVSPGGIL